MNNKFFALAEVFVAVVRHNSITDAASTLQTSKSNVSQKISELESLLDVVLLNRTTRKMTLTPAGTRMFETCVAAVDVTANAAISVGLLADKASVPRGRVILSASNAYLTCLVLPGLSGMLRKFPQIRIVLVGSDRRVDFSSENVDLGIRIGRLDKGEYHTTALEPLKRIICASPNFLEKAGKLKHPRELKLAPCILREQESRDWSMMCDHKRHTHIVNDPVIEVNTIELAHAAARNGVGLALLSEVVVREDIKQGRLRQVLSKWTMEKIRVNLLYRQSRIGRPAVRQLYNHLVNNFGLNQGEKT